MAGDEAVGRDLAQRRLFAAAAAERIGAARVEAAAWRRVHRARHVAFDDEAGAAGAGGGGQGPPPERARIWGGGGFPKKPPLRARSALSRGNIRAARGG